MHQALIAIAAPCGELYDLATATNAPLGTVDHCPHRNSGSTASDTTVDDGVPRPNKSHSLQPRLIMLTHVHINNYRVLRDLEISKLGRINVFTGHNNSGKTSLLEALFLLSGGGNPRSLMNSRIVRDIPLNNTGPKVMQDHLWKPLFSDLNLSNSICISCTDTVLRNLELTLDVDRSRIKIPQPMTPAVQEHTTYENSFQIMLRFKSGNGIDNESRIWESDQSAQAESSRYEGIPYNSAFVSTNSIDQTQCAKGLGALKLQRRSDPVLDSLRIIEPRLREIWESSVTGHPLLWGDVGLNEHIPLTLLGHGMVLVAQVMVSLLTSRDGLLLIDECENGIHHSVLAQYWQAINQASKATNTQIITTTHSYEAVAAIRKSVEPKDFYLHRLELKDAQNRCVTYGPLAVSGALEHGFEVR